MRLPVIRGVIDRRILVNYRVDPAVLAPLLPTPFRPKLHRGFAMVGICLIRLREIRPRFVPRWLGISSENAAHRAAVEWHDGGQIREGVYVRRRDTASRINVLAGGRIFPGVHSRARFTVSETPVHFDVACLSDDGATDLAVVAEVEQALPSTSVFTSVEEASAFFANGSLGYSGSGDGGRLQGLELRCSTWQVEPLAIRSVRSNTYDDQRQFPAGSIAFDCALLMRGIEHEWHGHQDL